MKPGPHPFLLEMTSNFFKNDNLVNSSVKRFFGSQLNLNLFDLIIYSNICCNLYEDFKYRPMLKFDNS